MRRATLIICLLVLAAVPSCASRDYEMTKKAGDYTVTVKIDKNPPVAGLNKMEILIKDSGGRDVTDAVVSVNYDMPAMPGMPAQNYETNAMLHGMTYHAIVNFSMAGPWTIAVKITKTGKTQTVKLNVDVK